MQKVFITEKGRVYHTRRDCKWYTVARKNAGMLGRKVHPLREVTVAEVGRRVPCRVCANGGSSPKRGPNRGNG